MEYGNRAEAGPAEPSITQSQKIRDELAKMKHYLDTHTSDKQAIEQHQRKYKNMVPMCDQIKAQRKT